MDFESRFLTYQKNVFSTMVEALAQELGVSANSINKLGIGFCPGKQSWVWAERDAKGNIVGLLHRYSNGQKRMEEGSKRGLVYECSENPKGQNIYQRNKFVRAYNAGVDCPLCGKRDWCLVSNENPSDPQAVICGRTSEGAERDLEDAGYLHIRKPAVNAIHGRPLLRPSNRACLAVEGVTDVLAAMDMDYVAIGRPSAHGGCKELASLLRGQEVIVVGENDDGDGRRGMHKVFQKLKAVASSIRKVLPPPEYKDLRDWHPTADEFEFWIKQHAEQADKSRILESDDPRYLARQWLEEDFQSPRGRLLHYCNQDWWQYAGFQYERVPDESLNSQLTSFLEQYEFVQQKGNATECKPFRMTRRFVDDVKFNLCTLCFLDIPDNSYRPFRINGKEFVDTTQAIAFRNGIYHVQDDKFEVISPDLFVISPLPYDYWPNADCSQWRAFIEEVFNGNQECIDLLQEWFGYNLVASNHMESMMFLYGGRAAGKSTTIDVLQAVLGPQGYTAIDIADLTSQFGFDGLAGKYAIIISEDKPTQRSESNKMLYKIKQITGRDTIIIRRKYKSAINIKPFFKITYIANELLDVSDESGSFRRRLNLLHYPNCYAENPDRQLKDRLIKEAPGIAIWAIEGLKRLLKTNQFTLPEKSKEHMDDVEKLGNLLRMMVQDHCIFKDELWTPSNELYDLHKAVYDENQIRPLSRIHFGIKLKAIFPEGVTRGRQRVAGELMYGYAGIGIMPAAYRRYLGRPV